MSTPVDKVLAIGILRHAVIEHFIHHGGDNEWFEDFLFDYGVHREDGDDPLEALLDMDISDLAPLVSKMISVDNIHSVVQPGFEDYRFILAFHSDDAENHGDKMEMGVAVFHKDLETAVAKIDWTDPESVVDGLEGIPVIEFTGAYSSYDGMLWDNHCDMRTPTLMYTVEYK